MAVCNDGGQYNVLLTVGLCLRTYPPVQYLQSLPCFHSTHTLVQAARTMAIYANATQWYTIYSVPVMHVRERLGFRAPIPSASMVRWTLKPVNM